ncbi:MAG: CatB-related O-acetyltransferase [Hyphomonadaceae bacterium]|nr:CatB-related O-acetyltransferase [Hyphomonadaceae bacterium]
MGLLKSAITRARLFFLRRRQFDNVQLRNFFSRNYDIQIGLYSYGCFDRWRMPGPIRIGRFCSFANTVRSAPNNHPMDALTTHPALYERSFGVVDKDVEWLDPPLVVEDDVWVGHNVMILPGCKFIGRGAVIGAGAVVTKNVDRYAIMAGNPARKLRDRFSPELVEAVEASRWWEMDIEKLRRFVAEHRDLAYGPTAETLRDWRRETAR